MTPSIDLGDNVEDLIDAEAEPSAGSAPLSSARDELNFYSATALAHKLEQSKLDLGLLGKFFGASASAPTNIAGMVIVASLVGIGLTYINVAGADAVELRKLLVGLIASALAFIFGAASKK